MQTNALLWSPLVFEEIADVEVEAVTAAFGTIEVVARGHAGGASCPGCGRLSDRVHDRYQRRLRDLPLADQGLVIRLTVRRFICGSGDCPRRTFAEPFPRLTVPHSRFTSRLNRALERVGLALAGRAGARLAAQLGFGAGRMTLLRRVMALPDPRFSTPRVLSVDDFALRRGQTYSTVLTSVEDRRVVDVLPTRKAGPLADWLGRHPGVEIICRDRAGALYRQRMDFLLLAPDRSRIVIEVDGVQHYGRPNPPDEQGRITHTAVPRLYAEMVTEDRRLRLAGYEIYRFCGWELKKGTGRQAALEILLHQPPRTAPEADAVKWWPHPAKRVAALHG
ncbi:transposase family protein [Streptomyces rochei]|uniref:transposase family protein n=1 Tax=Streptomyces rochei TaxID=1928 RepID=UPI003431E28D